MDYPPSHLSMSHVYFCKFVGDGSIDCETVSLPQMSSRSQGNTSSSLVDFQLVFPTSGRITFHSWFFNFQFFMRKSDLLSQLSMFKSAMCWPCSLPCRFCDAKISYIKHIPRTNPRIHSVMSVNLAINQLQYTSQSIRLLVTSKVSGNRATPAPSHHPFLDGFSMKSTIQLLGYLHLWTPRNDQINIKRIHVIKCHPMIVSMIFSASISSGKLT